MEKGELAPAPSMAHRLLLLACGLHATTGLVALAGSHARAGGALRPLDAGLRLQSPVKCGLFDMFKESDASKARSASACADFPPACSTPFAAAASALVRFCAVVAPLPNSDLTLTLTQAAKDEAWKTQQVCVRP